MAQPIQFTPRPPRIEPTAEEEWRKLLQACHQHGVLRLANDLVASNAEVTRLLVEKASGPEMLALIQNLSQMAIALASIPPEKLYRLVSAARDAGAAIVGETGQLSPPKAPGLVGAWRMLHDEQFWRGMQPLLGAIKAFGAGLGRPEQPPISGFSGKTARKE